jgi:hypothetical protein
LVEPKGKKQKSDGPTDKPKLTKAKIIKSKSKEASQSEVKPQRSDSQQAGVRSQQNPDFEEETSVRRVEDKDQAAPTIKSPACPKKASDNPKKLSQRNESIFYFWY